jgi:oligosaccharide repeat unit polymerase
MTRPEIHDSFVRLLNAYRFNQRERSWIFHPLTLFSGVWAGTVFLYSIHLSDLLLYNSEEALALVTHLWVPFFCSVFLYLMFFHFSQFAFGSKRVEAQLNFDLLTKRLSRWFTFWIVMSCVEIVISGGIPIVWLLQGSAKTYMDFGIPTVHGFMNSLLLSIAITNAALFGVLKRKRYLLLPAFVILWSMLAVTRNMMIVIVLEVSLLILQMQRIRFGTVLRAVGGVVILILIFGFIGDFRTGSEAFRLLAQPTKNYPEWLPSGVLWGYIYLATPLNNLIYTAHVTPPLYDPLFPNTLSSLLPTVLRTMVFGQNSATLGTGSLVTDAFNVSTAFAGPFQDFGYLGIILFSSSIGAVSAYFWKRTSLRDLLIYTVLAQCLLLTVFYNHFLLLPIITQVIWLSIFFMPEVRIGTQESATLES